LHCDTNSLDPEIFYEETYVRLTRSTDGGDAYEEISVIANTSIHPEDHLAPYVLTDSKNKVYVAWLVFINGGLDEILFRISKFSI